MPLLLCHFSFKYLPDGLVKRLSFHCLKFPLAVPKKASLSSFILRNVKSTPASSPSLKRRSVLTFFTSSLWKETSCQLTLLLAIKSELTLWVHCQTALWVSLSWCLTPHWTLQPPEVPLAPFFCTKWACDSSVLFQGLSSCFINQTVTICLIFSTCLSQ